VEIQLYDGEVVVVHELRPSEVKLVLTAMPALQKIANSFKTAGGEVGGLPLDIPEDMLEPAYPLLAACTGISEDALRVDYSLGELLTFMNTFNELLTKNFTGVLPAAQPLGSLINSADGQPD